jgi:CyaY protein
VTEQEFRLRADEALEQARASLLGLADAEGFEVELQNGVLQIEFEEPAPAKFVVSPNAPVRQVWVAALSQGYRLSWSDARAAFELEGEPLEALLARLVKTFLKR